MSEHIAAASEQVGNTAAGVADHAQDVMAAGKSAGTDVAQTAAEQAREVATEATRQARDLFGEAQSGLRAQVEQQHRKVVDGLRSLAAELDSMSRAGESDGTAAQFVGQARDRFDGLAGWLSARQPGDLLNDTRALARRNPGSFLLGAALSGVLVGRVTRGLAANRSGNGAATSTEPAQAPIESPVAAPTESPTQPLATSSIGYQPPVLREPGELPAVPGYATGEGR